VWTRDKAYGTTKRQSAAQWNASRWSEAKMARKRWRFLQILRNQNMERTIRDFTRREEAASHDELIQSSAACQRGLFITETEKHKSTGRLAL
jgi:hypothetical protein